MQSTVMNTINIEANGHLDHVLDCDCMSVAKINYFFVKTDIYFIYIAGFGGTKFISFEDRHWHSDCFVCYKCNNSMVGKGFLMNEGDILCPECGRN